MTPRDQLADALVDGNLEVARAVAAAERALAAWSAFPRSTRLAFPREARRLALRAASAVLAITTTLQERPHAPE
jgi:acyl-CoA reductase-like NAD-dependent aldehyde dehydrogenase